MEKALPKLRFPEFQINQTIAYRKYGFNDIFNFSTGKNIKQSEASPEFEIPCVRYGELYHMYNEVIYQVINKTNLDKSELLFSNGDEILLPSAGEDPLDIGSASALTIQNIAIGRTINILSPKNKNIYSSIYVSYYINQKLKKKIASLAKGVSISNVYNSDLKTLNIKLPSYDEQQKIASFLTSVDERLTLLALQKEKLELYKKGVMQQIFTQKLRFKDENGNNYPDWEEKKLGEICKVQGGFAFKSNEFKDDGIPVIRISNISNKTNHIDLNSLVFYKKIDKDENFTIKKGDLIIAMSGATTGKSSIYNLENIAYLNQRVGLFKSLTNKLDYNFLIQFIFSDFFKKQLDSVLVAGAQPNISSKDIESLFIPFPKTEEQQKIASFLSAIDVQIEGVNKKIAQTKLFKKGLLQQMFV
jgi:type I restriction enzyme S subunit